MLIDEWITLLSVYLVERWQMAQTAESYDPSTLWHSLQLHRYGLIVGLVNHTHSRARKMAGLGKSTITSDAYYYWSRRLRKWNYGNCSSHWFCQATLLHNIVSCTNMM